MNKFGDHLFHVKEMQIDSQRVKYPCEKKMSLNRDARYQLFKPGVQTQSLRELYQTKRPLIKILNNKITMNTKLTDVKVKDKTKVESVDNIEDKMM